MSKTVNNTVSLQKKDEAILNAESVINLFELFKKVLIDPGSAPMSLITACKSQNGLATLTLPDHNIKKMTLNTLKNHCDNNGNILWKQMDAYRKAFMKVQQQHIKSTNKTPRGSKTDLKYNIELLKKKLSQKTNDVIQFLDRYDDLLRTCRDYARIDADFEAKLERHLNRYSYMIKSSGQPRLIVLDGGRSE